ncbi:MAG: hypothetical protein NXH75_13155 [Halobacteriovoraceae bacterium]|nr:hypothetical protein [Halobacteriovoraceae bacterium]
MKLLISISLLLALVSCSSLREEKVINDGLGKDALSFYFSAEEYRLRGKFKEAINLYDRAGSIYISKLSYREYILTKLKKSLVFISLNKLKTADQILIRSRFWEKAFSLDLDSEIKAVEAKLHLARGENQEAFTTLKELIEINGDNLLLKTYYKSLSVETGIDTNRAYLPEITENFKKLYKQYIEKGTQNPDALIYIGKTLINQNVENTAQFVKQMETISQELEIPALSIFILKHYKKKANNKEKRYFQFLIDEIKRKEKSAILI